MHVKGFGNRLMWPCFAEPAPDQDATIKNFLEGYLKSVLPLINEIANKLLSDARAAERRYMQKLEDLAAEYGVMFEE